MDRGLRTYLRTQWNKNNNKKKQCFLFSFSLYAVYVLLNTRVYFHVQGCIKSTFESTNTNKEDLKKKKAV